jgi:hypothetical protein
MLNIFRDKNFRLLWLGQFLTIFGTRFSELALPWIVLNATGSPLKVGLVIICQHIGPMILAVPVGNWVENKNKKIVSLFADFTQFLAVAILVVAAFFDNLTLPIIGGLLFLLGMASLFFRVAFNSMLPAVFGRERLVDVHNSFEGADAVSTLIGPILAGLSISFIGAAWTLSIDALSFLLSFLTILFITYSFDPIEKEKKSQESIEGTKKLKGSFLEAFDGIKYLLGNKIQRLLTLTQFTLYFSTISVGLLVLVLTKQELELNATLVGIVFSSAGLGNLLGVVVMAKVKQIGWGKLLGSIFMVSSLGVFLITISSSFGIFCIGMFLFDGALSMAFVLYGTARQSITPDRLLARVGSAGVIVSSGTILFATSVSSTLAEFIGSRIPLGITSALIFTTGLFYIFNRSLDKPISKVKPIELEKKKEEILYEVYK